MPVGMGIEAKTALALTMSTAALACADDPLPSGRRLSRKPTSVYDPATLGRGASVDVPPRAMFIRRTLKKPS